MSRGGTSGTATTRRRRVAKPRVAVVEDDRDIALSLTHNLKAMGDMIPYGFRSGEEFLESLASTRPDAVILDLGLPGMDGLAVCRELRRHQVYGRIPILILTARVDEAEVVLGLDVGADDYVRKPFKLREVIARVKALLRRVSGELGAEDPPVYELPGVTLDMAECRLYREGEEIPITHKEMRLLERLIEAKGRVVTRDELLRDVWGYDFLGETRTVDVHVTRLRKKLRSPVIDTVIGMGYRLSKEAATALAVSRASK